MKSQSEEGAKNETETTRKRIESARRRGLARSAMRSVMIRGWTRVIGKAQGYLGLAIRDDVVVDETIMQEVPAMSTAWEPTPEELETLMAGGVVHIQLLGRRHPPIMVNVLPRMSDEGEAGQPEAATEEAPRVVVVDSGLSPRSIGKLQGLVKDLDQLIRTAGDLADAMNADGVKL